MLESRSKQISWKTLLSYLDNNICIPLIECKRLFNCLMLILSQGWTLTIATMMRVPPLKAVLRYPVVQALWNELPQCEDLDLTNSSRTLTMKTESAPRACPEPAARVHSQCLPPLTPEGGVASRTFGCAISGRFGPNFTWWKTRRPDWIRRSLHQKTMPMRKPMEF